MNLLIRLMDFFFSSSNWTHIDIILDNGYMMLLFSVILRLQGKRLNKKNSSVSEIFSLALLLKRWRLFQAREERESVCVLIISSASSDTYWRWNWRALRWHVCQSNKRFFFNMQTILSISRDTCSSGTSSSRARHMRFDYMSSTRRCFQWEQGDGQMDWRITSNQQT